MTDPQPSWKTSTLAQLAAASMICYLAGCLILIGGGGWFRKLEVIMVGFNGLRWAVEALVIGYLARQSAILPPNGKDQPPAPGAAA